MVQKAKFTDEDIIEYLNKNKANIHTLSRKFYYFTYLKKADLLQEGRLKIIELLRAFENGKITCELKDLDRYIGRSLVNHYVSLVRRYPSDEYFDPKKFAFSHGDEDTSIDDYLIYSLLHETLKPRELDIATLMLEEYTRKEISECLGIAPSSVNRIVRRIRGKLKKEL